MRTLEKEREGESQIKFMISVLTAFIEGYLNLPDLKSGKKNPPVLFLG